MKTMADSQSLQSKQKSNKKQRKVANINKQLMQLQRKILQVQNKNEKIIQKIHKAYNFKKKKQFYEQPEQYQQKPESPIVYYQKKSSNQNDYENYSSKSNISDVPNSAQDVQFYQGAKKMPIYENKSVVVDYEKKGYGQKIVTEQEQQPDHEYKSYIFQKLHKTHSDIAGINPTVNRSKSKSRSPIRTPPVLSKNESSNVGYQPKLMNMRRSEKFFQPQNVMLHSTFPTSLIDVNQGPYTPRYQNYQPLKSYTSIKPPQNIPISPVSSNMQYYTARNRQFHNQTYTQRSSKQLQIMQNIIQTDKQHILTLQQQLQQKQQKVLSYKKSKSKFKKYANNALIIFQDGLQNFMEQFVRNRLHEIERYVKKTQNRLHNLQLKLNQQKQEKEFQKYKQVAKHQRNSIKQRVERQNDNDDKNSSSSRISGRSLSAKKRIVGKSQSKKNNANQQKMKKQFQKISQNYQNMLKVKNDELLTQFSQVKKLQRHMFQLHSQNSQLKVLLQIEKKMKNIQFNSDSSVFDKKQKQYKFKLQEYESLHRKFRQDLYEKQSQIKKLQKKLNNISIEAQNDKTSQIILQLNQKIRKLVQQNAKIPKLQIQLEELQQIITKKQQTLSQKDSQIYLTQSRLKKSQSENKLKDTKIQDLSRILKQMHDQQIKSQKSFYQHVVVDNNILQDLKLLQIQLQNKEKEILQIKKINQTSTKRLQIEILQKNNKTQNLQQKIKSLQSKNSECLSEIDRLKAQLSQKQKDTILEDNIQSQYFDQVSSPKFRSQSSYNNTNPNDRYNELSSNFSAIKQENMEILSQRVQLEGQIQYLRDLVEKQTKKNQKQRQEMQLLSNRIRELDTYNQELMIMVEQQLRQRKNQKVETGQNDDQKHLMDFEGVSPLNFNKLGQSIEPVPLKGSFMYSSWNFSQKDDILLDRSLKFQPRNSNKSKQINRESLNAMISQLHQKLETAQKTISLKDQLKEQMAKQYARRLQILTLESQTQQNVMEKYIKQNEDLRKKNLELYNNINQNSQQKQITNKQPQKQDNIGQFQAFLQNDPQLQKLQYQQKIAYMGEQLAEQEETNVKLQQMLKSILQKLKLKQQEKNQFLIELQQKTNTIEDLNDLIQLKDLNISSGFSKQGIRRSTLKQSTISAARKVSDESINFHLIDQNNQNFLQQSGLSNSMSQNMSMIFQKQENFFQRIRKDQAKRKNQSKLFAKTFQYIKSLKTIISQKNKKINILESRLDQLKDNCWLWKKNGEQLPKQQIKINQHEFATHEVYFQNQFNHVNDVFECRSQQLDKKKKPHHNKYKRMEYDTKLITQENKILTRQVQILQQEIGRLQEQETSLMSVKDMYKQQIRFLTTKINDMGSHHENELKTVRQKLQESQSVQKLQALKQLLLKISQTFKYMQDPSNKKPKRDQKKKQLQQCLKVTFSILQIQNYLIK